MKAGVSCLPHDRRPTVAVTSPCSSSCDVWDADASSVGNTETTTGRQSRSPPVGAVPFVQDGARVGREGPVGKPGCSKCRPVGWSGTGSTYHQTHPQTGRSAAVWGSLTARCFPCPVSERWRRHHRRQVTVSAAPAGPRVWPCAALSPVPPSAHSDHSPSVGKLQLTESR